MTDIINTATVRVVYDERSKYFSAIPGENHQVLAMKMNYFDDKLRAQGHLFLNEVLDSLGLPRIRKGQSAGWLWQKYKWNDNLSFGLLHNVEITNHNPIGPIGLAFNCRDNILDEVFGEEGK